MEARIPYRPMIVKQPKADPNRSPTPKPEKKEVEVPVAEEKPVTDSRNVNVVTIEKTIESAPVVDETSETTNTEVLVQAQPEADPDMSIVEDGFAHAPSNAIVDQQPSKEKTPEPEKSPEDILLEKQLASVQQQLLALSSLPSTIQATLDSVARQLEELVPVIKSKTSAPKVSEAPALNGAAAEIEHTQPTAEGRKAKTIACMNGIHVNWFIFAYRKLCRYRSRRREHWHRIRCRSSRRQQ